MKDRKALKKKFFAVAVLWFINSKHLICTTLRLIL